MSEDALINFAIAASASTKLASSSAVFLNITVDKPFQVPGTTSAGFACDDRNKTPLALAADAAVRAKQTAQDAAIALINFAIAASASMKLASSSAYFSRYPSTSPFRCPVTTSAGLACDDRNKAPLALAADAAVRAKQSAQDAAIAGRRS
eukprot:CAMPEP_0117509168 /NCGR_PEP_ID=MMETSP0784-20121206/27332_1 /TAXON_ID=39447 /ORGANISM="" /LENGTH=149 /DNA_ID=CAMNT_0005304759 /DNA_START=151 /DNA_END=596 /DNA_ORIENTATION=-